MTYLRPPCKPIPEEALEMIADVLLASSQQNDANPIFDERQLIRKHKRDFKMGFTAVTQDTSIEDDEESPISGLKPRQRIVWDMYMDGHSPSDIAAALGITRPTVIRRLRNAAGIVASNQPRLRGLRAVYRSEIGRHEYEKPRHCAGEPCRKLGYCRYAHLRR